MSVPVVHNSGDLLFVPQFIDALEEAGLLRALYGTDDDSGAPPRHRWVQLRHRRLLNLGGVVGGEGTTGPMIPESVPPWALGAVAARLQSTSAALTAAPEENAKEGLGAQIRSAGWQGAVCTAAINHVLVNEYRAGSGIMPHEDGPAYEPIVAIVSIGGPVTLRFRPKRTPRAAGEAPEGEGGAGPSMEAIPAQPTSSGSGGAECVDVFLPPRSLVVFKGRFYTDYLHGIPDAEVDTVDPRTCLNYSSAHAYLNEMKIPAGGGEDGECVSVPRAARRVSLTYRRVLRVAKLSAAALFGKR